MPIPMAFESIIITINLRAHKTMLQICYGSIIIVIIMIMIIMIIYSLYYYSYYYNHGGFKNAGVGI